MNRGCFASSARARRSSWTHEVRASSLTAVPFQTLSNRWSFDTGVPAWCTSRASTALAFGVSRISRAPDHRRPVRAQNTKSPKLTRSSMVLCRDPSRPTLGEKRGPHRGIELPAQAGHEWEQCVDVRHRRVEVHDAGAQQECAGDDRVGEECLAALLNLGEQRLIELIQIGLHRRRSESRPEIGGYVSERRDAEALAGRVELRMIRERLVEVFCDRDVVADHLHVTVTSDLPQRQPYLQCTESARILR